MMNNRAKKQFDKIDHSLFKLMEELKDYSHHALNKKPTENAWSVLQTIHHLMLVEKNAHLYLQKKLSFDPKLKNAGILAAFRSFGINFYLNSPIKAKAPVAVSGDNLPEESSFWETAKAWNKQREELNAFLESLPATIFKKEAYNHPAAGRMSIYQMLRFFEAHFNNHRKQIKRTLR